MVDSRLSVVNGNSPRFCRISVIELGWLTGFFQRADNTYYAGRSIFARDKKAGNLVLSAMFSFPCLARGSLEMRNYIISSIANVIRYRAAAVDMLRMVIDPAATQWHVQLCAVQPTGDSYQRSHVGLLTSGGTNDGIGNSLSLALAKLLKPANERLFVETTGNSCQQCPTTSGSSGSRVS